MFLSSRGVCVSSKGTKCPMLIRALTICPGVVLAGIKAFTEKLQRICCLPTAQLSPSVQKPSEVSEEVVFLECLLVCLVSSLFPPLPESLFTCHLPVCRQLVLGTGEQRKSIEEMFRSA